MFRGKNGNQLIYLKAMNMKTALKWQSANLQSAAQDGIRVMPKCFQTRFIIISTWFQKLHAQIAPGDEKQDIGYISIVSEVKICQN